jgi:hypothetical protein
MARKPTNCPTFLPSFFPAATRRDISTLSFDEAVRNHTLLDEVNQTVADWLQDSRDSTDAVYYDPNTQSFWAYPQ